VDHWLHDRRPVRRVQRRPDAAYDRGAWPYTLPPVAQLLRDGLDLPAGVTFLVGENGSGKSTVVEAVAAAAGLNAEGGAATRGTAPGTSESPLHEALQLVRSAGAPAGRTSCAPRRCTACTPTWRDWAADGPARRCTS
jgi:predicted ATPase